MVQFSDRDVLINKKRTKKASQRTIFSTTYSPTALKANQLIRKYWHKIRKMISLSTKVRSTPMFAPRTNKHIRDHLVRAKLPPLNDDQDKQPIPSTQLSLQITPPTDCTTQQFQPCRQPHCSLDQLINPSPLAKSFITNKTHPIRENICYTSTNVIYLITCKTCNTQFIGYTHTQPLDYR